MRKLVYSFPDETKPNQIGEFVCTEQEAIKIQREYALKTHGYSYETDQIALDDYICVNWAYWLEEL